jgi:hypothetical protein
MNRNKKKTYKIDVYRNEVCAMRIWYMYPTERMKGREKEKDTRKIYWTLTLEEKHVGNNTKLKEMENWCRIGVDPCFPLVNW